MSHRIALAVPDAEVARQAAALAEEAGDIEVLGTAIDSGEVAEILERTELDAILLHEELGPLPVLELTRQLGSKYPTVGFLLLAREATPDLLRQALRSNVRDVIGLPLNVEAVAEAVASASAWSRAVRDRMDEEGLAHVADRIGGRIIAIAGAKGGVGTTTIALQLALAAARFDADRPVCLAEFDLQTGDLRALLDLQSRRSVSDLAAVADEVTTRSLDETLYVHASGLRVLLAPDHGEDGEDVSAAAARQIMGALKFQYDLVVCDVGSVMSEASAVAVEMANDALVVTTPDVPGLRAANRLLRLWDRLRIRGQDATVVLNRVHKENEIQPEFARRVLSAPMRDTTIPAGFRDLEAPANTGVPTRLDQGSVHRALQDLAEEVDAVPTPAKRRRLRLRPARAGSAAEAGQVSVEVAGLTAIVVLVVLCLWQVVLVGYTYELAGHSARAGARAYAVGEDVDPPATKALPRAWRDGADVVKHDDWVRVTLKVPLVVPGISSPIKVSDRKVTVIEDQPLPASMESSP